MTNSKIYSVERETMDDDNSLIFETCGYSSLEDAMEFNGKGMEVIFASNKKNDCNTVKDRLNKIYEDGIKKIKEDQNSYVQEVNVDLGFDLLKIHKEIR